MFANIGRDFQAYKARFKSKEGVANFTGLKGDSVRLANTVFQGPVAFASANIVTNFEAYKARFESKEAGAIFISMKVGGEANFWDAVFQAPVDFRLADIGDLGFVGKNFQLKKGIKLNGLIYKNIYTGAWDNRDHKKVLEILRMDDYRPQPYQQLESCYIGLGYKEGADAVFVEGKRRERQASWTWLSWDLPTNILKFTFLEKGVGYGRYLHRVFWPAIIFIGLGTLVFSKPGMFENGEKLSVPSAFWYSLGVFLPFVTLGTDKFHRIEKNTWLNVESLFPRASKLLPAQIKTRLALRLESYYYCHQLLGYILLSIGIASIPGIIK